uniref:Uncharacterized protein n=1 Tax=Chromera velia CCMP2878 TaxID=1169474 RepID=A0A0G4HIU6_9ALVE|eukprot:Cvel_27927.t1-p1 / transcript=Cvel_27927.t1 / gene=Cvel_27927 / organism=Chromera_velia_CCMP2878 / gene_product=hypothetical protein / transcript_product=hypothetical protein / location=Cvel_scaffold3561:4335-12497(+) / protein_length=1026 / sequence_SO=supercontig / SO=protein_coding / is_pseudo=false
MCRRVLCNLRCRTSLRFREGILSWEPLKRSFSSSVSSNRQANEDAESSLLFYLKLSSEAARLATTRYETGLFDQWASISMRAVDVLARLRALEAQTTREGAPKSPEKAVEAAAEQQHALTSVIFVMHHLAEADLEFTERRLLKLPRAFRDFFVEVLANDLKRCLGPTRYGRCSNFEVSQLSGVMLAEGLSSLSVLSDDEICIAALALSKCGLVDRAVSLAFFQALQPSYRFRNLSATNLVRISQAFRQFRFLHPDKKIFSEILFRLLMKRREEVAQARLLPDAVAAIGALTSVNPPTLRRLENLLGDAVPSMSVPELTAVPLAFARLGVSSESLFLLLSRTIFASLHKMATRDISKILRGLLRSRVGPPGARSSGLFLFSSLPLEAARKRREDPLGSGADGSSPFLLVENLSAASAVRLLASLSRLRYVHLGDAERLWSDRRGLAACDALATHLLTDLLAPKARVLSSPQLLICLHAVAHLQRKIHAPSRPSGSSSKDLKDDLESTRVPGLGEDPTGEGRRSEFGVWRLGEEGGDEGGGLSSEGAQRLVAALCGDLRVQLKLQERTSARLPPLVMGDADSEREVIGPLRSGLAEGMEVGGAQDGAGVFGSPPPIYTPSELCTILRSLSYVLPSLRRIAVNVQREGESGGDPIGAATGLLEDVCTELLRLAESEGRGLSSRDGSVVTQSCSRLLLDAAADESEDAESGEEREMSSFSSSSFAVQEVTHLLEAVGRRGWVNLIDAMKAVEALIALSIQLPVAFVRTHTLEGTGGDGFKGHESLAGGDETKRSAFAEMRAAPCGVRRKIARQVIPLLQLVLDPTSDREKDTETQTDTETVEGVQESMPPSESAAPRVGCMSESLMVVPLRALSAALLGAMFVEVEAVGVTGGTEGKESEGTQWTLRASSRIVEEVIRRRHLLRAKDVDAWAVRETLFAQSRIGQNLMEQLWELQDDLEEGARDSLADLFFHVGRAQAVLVPLSSQEEKEEGGGEEDLKGDEQGVCRGTGARHTSYEETSTDSVSAIQCQ